MIKIYNYISKIVYKNKFTESPNNKEPFFTILSFLKVLVVFSLINFFIPLTRSQMLVLILYSISMVSFYVYITKLYKSKIFIIYTLLLSFIICYKINLVFLYLNGMTVLLLIFILFNRKNNNVYNIHILLLNIFLLSISFIIFKYLILTLCCLKFRGALHFDLGYSHSKIALEITLSNSCTPYLEGQYKIFLNEVGFNSFLKKLGSLSDERYWFINTPIPIDLMVKNSMGSYLHWYLYWLCYITDYLPFFDLTLILY